MRIIPAIDVLGGKCVRLTRGDYNTVKVYDTDPLEVAMKFEETGFHYLHLVDLDGAREKHIVNHDVLRSITASTKLAVDFGGGIKSEEDLKIVFDSGASSANIGSIAVTDPELFLRWIDIYGNQRIILSADSYNRKIMTRGWTESSETDVVDFISGFAGKGVRYVTCTDISKDGMMNGPSLDLYREILSRVDISLIASGGITAIADIIALKEAGCEGAIIGKAIYEGNINPEDLIRLC